MLAIPNEWKWYIEDNKQYRNDVQQSVLDIGCGVGGDIMKFYYVAVAYYVGIDIVKEGLFSAVNGAISRYNNSRRNKPNFPKMDFILLKFLSMIV